MLRETKLGWRLISLYQMRRYLEEVGWLQSRLVGLPVDRNGCPLPWFTYPAISFLENRVKSEMRVFEYGSGNSTLWWGDRVSSVVSCEHDSHWYDLMKSKIPSKVEYIYRELASGGEYSRAIVAYEDAFDIVVIDGRDRVNCARNALRSLVRNGVIVWDNSERPEYRDGHAYLTQNGFDRLDFYGLGPLNTYAWCTSIFYRQDNCFGI